VHAQVPNNEEVVKKAKTLFPCSLFPSEIVRHLIHELAGTQVMTGNRGNPAQTKGVTLGIILREPLDDILRGLLPRLASRHARVPEESESGLGARVRFPTSIEP
jgi:hypothetical protein